MKFSKYADNPDEIQSFKEALSVELRLLARRKSKFDVLAFLNVTPERFRAIGSLRIGEYQLRFLAWNELKGFDLAALWKKAQAYSRVSGQRISLLDETGGDCRPRFQVFTPILVSLESYSPEDALATAAEHMDLFRATLNFGPATRIMIGYGYGAPLCKFLPSPVYGAYDSQGQLLLDMYTTEHYGYVRQEQVNDQEFETATELIRRINSQDKDLLRLFVRLLYLYQQALDFTDYRAKFLALWQVLESAVLDDPDQRVRVDKRLANLLQMESDPLLNQALTLLVHRRNTLVHYGLFPEDAHDLVFALKKFADLVLFRILSLAGDLSDETELREYLSHATVNDAALARRRKIIELIQSARKND